MEWLKGKKTFIIAGLMVISSLVKVVVGDLTFLDFLASENLGLFLEGLGLGFLRAGVNKAKQ